MATLFGYISAIGEHIPITKSEHFSKPNPQGWISAFHYRGTAILLGFFSVLVTCSDIFTSDAKIECLVGSVPDPVISNYCYIMGTFTLPNKFLRLNQEEIGYYIADVGVGPFHPTQDQADIEVKAYYQWVPFMLFFQALMFYVPHIIFKIFERGKIRGIIFGLNNYILDDEDRHSKEEDLAKYIAETKGTHWGWCLRIMGCDLINLANVVFQIWFTDMFLGYEFSLYGVSAASFLEENIDQHERIDPMSRVFPRMAKCTFRKFGPSGSVQTHDAQCILPLNIVNEKIYVFLWFWFCFLAIITALNILFMSVIIFNKTAWRIIMNRKLRLAPRKESPNIDQKLILSQFDFGDWKLVYQLMKNMDALVFYEFCEKLTDIFLDEEEVKIGNDGTLRLTDLDNNDKPNITYDNES